MKGKCGDYGWMKGRDTATSRGTAKAMNKTKGILYNIATGGK